jgi:hypothetical protein
MYKSKMQEQGQRIRVSHFEDTLPSLQLIAPLFNGTVPDEIILEVPDELANDAAAILRETMIQAGKVYLSGVPVEVEVTIGDTWAEKWTSPPSAS